MCLPPLLEQIPSWQPAAMERRRETCASLTHFPNRQRGNGASEATGPVRMVAYRAPEVRGFWTRWAIDEASHRLAKASCSCFRRHPARSFATKWCGWSPFATMRLTLEARQSTAWRARDASSEQPKPEVEQIKNPDPVHSRGPRERPSGACKLHPALCLCSHRRHRRRRGHPSSVAPAAGSGDAARL